VSGPLDGVRVIDMTMNVMGPYAAQILGDMGADVCKVEPPEGDTLRGIGPSRSKGMGPYFMNLNRNKRSLVLDLKQPQGIAVLQRMLGQADVLLYSFRPKAMERLGLSYAEVAAVNPRIIYCGTFGYGQSGPYADKPAYDDLIQTAIGIPVLQARGLGEPTYVAMAIADRVVGMMGASAIGMALYSTRAILHGRGGDVWEMVRENVLSLKARCGSASPPIELPRGMRVVKHRCHGQTAIAQLAGAIGCAHSQIFCRCRKRTCGSSTDSRLVFAGAPAKFF